MCLACYKSMGAPVDICATTQQAVDAVREIYQWSSVGGNAHTVVDDWNLDDEYVEYCLNETHWINKHASNAEKTAVRLALMLFKDMTIDQRATVLALKEGFISNGG
jgi:hypothetical protein